MSSTYTVVIYQLSPNFADPLILLILSMTFKYIFILIFIYFLVTYYLIIICVPHHSVFNLSTIMKM